MCVLYHAPSQDDAQHKVTQLGRQSNWARSTFLSNLPTLVLGISSTSSMRSGTCQRREPEALEVHPELIEGDRLVRAGHDAGERALEPAGVGHGDHRRLGHRGPSS